MTPGNSKVARSHFFVFYSHEYKPISPQMPVFSQEQHNPFPHFLSASSRKLILPREFDYRNIAKPENTI